jgi:hypothetical protein
MTMQPNEIVQTSARVAEASGRRARIGHLAAWTPRKTLADEGGV